jgi:hypothetical protein
VQFRFEARGNMPAVESSPVEIREATVNDANAVVRLSFSAHFWHYHVDCRFDRVKVSEAYVDWAQRSCTLCIVGLFDRSCKLSPLHWEFSQSTIQSGLFTVNKPLF